MDKTCFQLLFKSLCFQGTIASFINNINGYDRLKEGNQSYQCFYNHRKILIELFTYEPNDLYEFCLEKRANKHSDCTPQKFM